jgi:hypothetical protein
LGLFRAASSDIPEELDVRLLMTADGRGHEALLRHAARGGFFFARGVVAWTVVDRGNPGK